MVNAVDTRPLSDFLRNADERLTSLRDSGNPEVLTVDGRAELVVQSAAAYQKLVDLADEAESIRVLRERIAAADAGAPGIPAEEVFESIRQELGLGELT